MIREMGAAGAPAGDRPTGGVGATGRPSYWAPMVGTTIVAAGVPGSAVADSDANDVSATATLVDVLLVDAVAELVFQRRAQPRVRVALVGVRDEVHVVPRRRVLDRVDRIPE